jgi:hypothetical protein
MFLFGSVARGDPDENRAFFGMLAVLLLLERSRNVIVTDLAPLEAALPRMLAQIGEE